MTGLAAELDDPTTAPERRRKLIALVERIQTTFKGHSQPDTEIRVALLESIRWTVEELPRLKAAFEARSPDRRVLVEPFVAALCEAPPERVALGRFESSYPALRTQLEGQLSALRDGIASWRGKRGPAKGNLPRGPGKWDVLNKLMIACRFATETSTASGLEKEWERRPQNPKSGQRPHAMWEDMARLYDLNPLAKIIPNPYREFARELAEHVQRRRNGVGS